MSIYNRGIPLQHLDGSLEDLGSIDLAGADVMTSSKFAEHIEDLGSPSHARGRGVSLADELELGGDEAGTGNGGKGNSGILRGDGEKKKNKKKNNNSERRASFAEQEASYKSAPRYSAMGMD